MSELRIIETNSADDARGRVFGLDGDLYLPLVLASVLGLAGWAGLHFVLHAPWLVALAIPGLPAFGVAVWIVGFRQGRPAGYDRDQIDQWIDGGSFTLAATPVKEARR
jgi:hypothetical protein